MYAATHTNTRCCCNIIYLVLLATSYTCVYTMPLLNEVKLQFTTHTHNIHVASAIHAVAPQALCADHCHVYTNMCILTCVY